MDEGMILGIPAFARTWRGAARQHFLELTRDVGVYGNAAGGLDQVPATPNFAQFASPLSKLATDVKLVELYTANTSLYQRQVETKFVARRPVGV
jgi:hypothetical protein